MKGRTPDTTANYSPRRITGLETEYGCLVDPPLQVYEVIAQVRDWIFSGERYGLIDKHDRDWDEPAGNGGFLFNGGRLYLDMGHLEYSTGECSSTRDVIRYDRAGDHLLNEALEALGMADKVTFVRNNIDHYTGATFGCHENYSLLRSAPLTQKNVLSLLTFLTIRTVYAGAGRVRGSSHSRRVIGEDGAARETGPFQISQRADYIQNDFFEWVQHNRAIINTRDEPLADPRHYRRLHLIHGDTNVLPSANFLKIGSTRLVFDLLEANDLPNLALHDAVTSLRTLSRSLIGPWRIHMSDGKHLDAVELLSQYHYRAHRRFSGRDAETDAILKLWCEVMEKLTDAKQSLVGTLDWVTKEHLFHLFCESEGIGWDHPWLEAQDLEFHSISPTRSLAMPLANMSGLWATGEDHLACKQPPTTTRANERSRLMHAIQERPTSYAIDWDSVQVDDRDPTYLLDPFQSGPNVPSTTSL